MLPLWLIFLQVCLHSIGPFAHANRTKQNKHRILLKLEAKERGGVRSVESTSSQATLPWVKVFVPTSYYNNATPRTIFMDVMSRHFSRARRMITGTGVHKYIK